MTIKDRIPKKQLSSGISLRWTYILLPLIILGLSVIVTLVFYSRLPSQVAYQFNSDGSPSAWAGKALFFTGTILPQVVLTLMALAFTWGVTRLSLYFKQPKNPRIKPGTILLAMGNMVALPQVILGYFMLDVCLYNVYGVRLLPLWIFIALVMVVGGLILGAFFVIAALKIQQGNR